MATNLLLLAVFVSTMILMSLNQIKRKKKVIFFGDSITEEGSRRGGFIHRIKELQRNEGVEDKYELVNAGINANKVEDLYERLDADVIAQSPTVVVLFVGINDVWQKQSAGATTDVSDFKRLYTEIVTKLQAADIKVVLCNLTAIGEKNESVNELDEDLALFNAMIDDAALTYNVLLVNLHRAFTEYHIINNTANRGVGILTTDGVHLNDNGNQLVAEEMWKVLKGVK